ncbi:MAG: ACP S-malonyltransferase [Chloroflexota bacterium]
MNSFSMRFLSDYNMEGHAKALWKTLQQDGWLELLPLNLLLFKDAGLDEDMSDRDLWRYVQENRIILLTGNRSNNDADSLQQTMDDENTPTSLPVLTIANLDNVRKYRFYRERCAERIAEIVFDLDNYLGSARVFIP